MQHLSPQICKRLEALGLVSESGKNWCAGHDYYDDPDSDESHFEACEWDVPIDDDDGYCPSAGMTCEHLVPAFTISDILLNADNAKKLWGEATTGWSGNPDEKEWHFQTHELLDLHLSGTDIEPHLLEAIESKPL